MNRREALSRALLVGTAGGLVTLAGCSTDGSGGGGGDDPPDGGTGDGGAGGGATGDGATGDDTDPSPTPGDSETRTATDGDDVAESSPTASERRSDGGLDLREANATGVAVEQRDGRRFRFDVTLYHDDEGEDGYANWWQVETREGERLGRRELLHAHGTREFTRSETVEVPAGVDCVVVRGHDQIHDYGGRAALVRVSSGEVRFVDQGPEPARMTGEDCP